MYEKGSVADPEGFGRNPSLKSSLIQSVLFAILFASNGGIFRRNKVRI